MKTNQDNWNEKLRTHLGDDESRFPVSENHFESLKQRILDKTKNLEQIQAKGSKLRSLWLLALPAAAALVFFMLNRSAVPQDTEINSQSLNEAADHLYEKVTQPAPLIELNKEEMTLISESESFEQLRAEVVLEDMMIEDMEEDPFASLQEEDIEDYLAEYSNIHNEL